MAPESAPPTRGAAQHSEPSLPPPPTGRAPDPPQEKVSAIHTLASNEEVTAVEAGTHPDARTGQGQRRGIRPDHAELRRRWDPVDRDVRTRLGGECTCSSWVSRLEVVW